MIKLKNKIIIFVVFLVLIIGSIVLINNKDIKVSSVSSSGKRYEISYSQGVKKNECDKWYDEYDNKIFNYNEVEEGYPLFIYNHCAVKLDDYLSKVDNGLKKTACDVQKSFVKKNYYFNEEMINNYNANCYDSGIDSEKLNVSYEGKSCSEMKENIVNKFQENYSLYENVYKNNCISSTGDIDKNEIKNYYSELGNCESLKLVKGGNLYTGILKPNSTVYGSKNTCGYPLFYVDGYATGLDDYLSKVSDNLKIAACSYAKSLIENGDNTYKDIYTSRCASLPNIETKYITFDATTGYGMECSGYAVSNGVCRYSFKYNSDNNQVENKTITLPNVTTTLDGNGLYEIGTGKKFSYWSKNNNCSTKDIMRGTTSLNINNLNYEGTYYACYSDDSSNTVENMTNIYKTCDVANDYQPTLTSTIINTDDYSTSSLDNNQAITKSNKTYTINKYCPMKCTETFEYTYPSIFETVKSGTYFELIYTPQVKSTYKCTQTFNYDLWKTSYNTAIDNEKKAYVDYQNAEGINIINSPSDYGSEDSSCGVKRSWSCGTTEHPRTCYEYYKRYTISFIPQVYNISSKTFGNGTSVSATYCENDNISTAKSGLFNQINQQLDTTKKLSEISSDTDSTYVAEKGKREKLQNMNKTCYDTLSTDSISTKNFYSVEPNVTIKYDLDTTMNKEVKLTTDDPYYNNDYLDRKDVTEEYNISYGSTNEKFNAYTFGDNHITTRTKKVNYEFHTNFNYYSNFYTGRIDENSNGIYLGNVFPVRLASSGKRNISFIMDTSNNSTLSGNVRSKLSDGNNNTYKCTYNISNDAVMLDDESKRDSKEDEKDYKTTFFVRPVATNDVDPNNRLDKGLLGANWASNKGQELIKIIEDKSKNNNTYNPNNLEYSFTLNANTLDQIREYNKTKGSYDNVDWSESCNNLGMECQSKFLNGLSNGSLGAGMDVKNTNAKFDGRNKKKYYINGKWVELDKITSYTGTECSSFKGNISNYYDCLYRNVNEGVTP